MIPAALHRRAREARQWLLEACFPLWASDGLGEGGLFAERLTLQHSFQATDTTRVRVQARQTYVFAKAFSMGWEPDRALRLVDMGTATLSGPALRLGGIAGRTLSTRTTTLADDTADLYDTAFTLFALAEAQAATGTAQPAIATILTGLDRLMRDEINGGYAEALPVPEERSQNPHMHLLEACHALYRADTNPAHLRRGAEIVHLFETRMTNHPTGTLGEVFTPDWSAPAPANVDYIEPGHQFEWVWLLAQHAKLTAAPPSETLAPLYATACDTLDPAGRVLSQVHRDGTPVDSSRRTWQQTDALKAHLALLELTDDPAYATHAVTSFDLLMDEFLTQDGGWIDHQDASGKPLTDSITAATGYHVVLAFSELMRVTGS